MGKYIYKITNKINNKSYIGQTKDIKQRWNEHRWYHSTVDKVLYLAMRKYGVENFEITCLGFFKNYNEKERDFIKQHSTLAPNGYNITEGGEEPPILSGEDSIHCSVSDREVERIQHELLNGSKSIKEIFEGSSYGDIGSIARINTGQMRYDSNLNYPLRDLKADEDRLRSTKIKKLLKNTNKTQKEIARMCGVSRTTVTAINNGQNWFSDKESYPIR